MRKGRKSLLRHVNVRKRGKEIRVIKSVERRGREGGRDIKGSDDITEGKSLVQ